MQLKCDICAIKIIDLKLQDYYKGDKHYIMCKKCLKNINICSKSKCKKTFMLNDEDIKDCKMIYLENNTYTFYLYDDIKQIVVLKYGSFDKLQELIDKQNKTKENKLRKSQNIRADRETKLKNAFELNKLEYKNYGDCYSFINYGKPSLEEVINNELIKLHSKNQRINAIAHALARINLPLDESLQSCYEYINGLTNKNLDLIIRSIEIEHFLKYKTDYDELCKKYDPLKAKDIAISRYSMKNKLPINIDSSYKKIKISFE